MKKEIRLMRESIERMEELIGLFVVNYPYKDGEATGTLRANFRASLLDEVGRIIQKREKS